MVFRRAVVIGVVFFGLLLSAEELQLPTGCDFNKDCIVELPGAVCADGSPYFFTLRAQRNSKDLLIFLQPGGACWSAETCGVNQVISLNRKSPQKLNLPEKGLLDLSNPSYPFYGFSKITLPYCTGDVFLGDKEINYGTKEKPSIMRHRGYRNVQQAMDVIKSFMPHPERVVLFGRSAGGMGVLGHVRNLDEAFPDSIKYALADAGTPLLPAYLDENQYRTIMNNWNAFETLPQANGDERMDHLGDLLHYNTVHFPHIRYGLIQSYEDRVMTFFAKNVGSQDPSSAVRKSIIDSSDNYIGIDTPHAKVFFVEGKTHVLSKSSLSRTQSVGMSLGQWLKLMFSNEVWPNIRPDLNP